MMFTENGQHPMARMLFQNKIPYFLVIFTTLHLIPPAAQILSQSFLSEEMKEAQRDEVTFSKPTQVINVVLKLKSPKSIFNLKKLSHSQVFHDLKEIILLKANKNRFFLQVCCFLPQGKWDTFHWQQNTSENFGFVFWTKY